MRTTGHHCHAASHAYHAGDGKVELAHDHGDAKSERDKSRS
jgi:hypothetical protein